MSRKTLLSVGNLLDFKGHDLAIRALARLADWELRVVGSGPERQRLENLAADYGVGERVRFAGQLSQEALRDYYGAADALVLASSREGWPNVLLEAMACGTPVAATAVGGCSEIVASPEAGVLITERTPQAIAAAIERLQVDCADRQATRRYAEQFGWAATSRGQLDLFRRILGCDAPARGDALAA